VQTKLKHEILTNYLQAYCTVLGSNHLNLIYVDGFAGRGFYSEGDSMHPGSPIRAMQLFAKSDDHRSKVTCFFVESNEEYVSELQTKVEEQQTSAPLKKKPVVYGGSFADFMSQLRQHLTQGNDLAPTFLFVDPCGVDGVKMADLSNVLARAGCELFLFFNYEGINRIAGNAEKQGSSDTLVALFGSEERVQHLIGLLRVAEGPRHREEIILSEFFRSLRESADAKYQLPFRIEHEAKGKTSHYLLHATKHPHGFKIMKSVMGKAARNMGGVGGLELLQASNKRGGQLFEPPSFEIMRQDILTEIAKGPRKVSMFRTDWVVRPTDMFTDDDYKRVILELEASNKIVVFDKHNLNPKPAAKRGRKDSTGITQTTLGDCWLRLA
jgi:three-Cys-motif partner protein